MKQSGIALIQVLLIVAILSVLALYLTKTAQDQVKVAQWFDDKNTALVQLHSAESELLFTLLTELKTSKTGEIPKQWNFFNTLFNINDAVVVKMQDQAGLLNVHFPDQTLLNKLAGSLGVEQGRNFSDVLLDWQDTDEIARVNGRENQFTRNGKVPHIHDFIHISNIPPEIYKVLQNNMSIYRSGYYNPMNSPLALLTILTNRGIAEKVIALRSNGELNKRSFSELTGLKESENMFFYPSNNIAIQMKSTVGESTVSKEIVIALSSYATLETPPLLVLYARG